MLEAGQVIEKYTVERPLGEGGMARVYLVRHSTLDTLHALKVLTLSGKGLTERLVAEGKVQATLQHPNVVRVLDVVEVDGQPGLVMDYVDGPDLDEWIRTARPDPVAAEAVFRGVVAGVKAAHDQGLIHRDLKPANVLLATLPDGTLVPKVADFGLSKAITGDQSKSLTRSGMPMGTPSYMAPEQIRDAAGVDARADVFSLGCILHELVTHTTAYDGEDVVSIFNAVLDDQRAPLDSSTPNTPPHLQVAVDACLVGDRDRRLASCDDLLAVLDGAARPPEHTVVKVPVAPWVLGSGLVAFGVAGLTVLGVASLGGLWWWSGGVALPSGEPGICSTWTGTRGWVRHPGLIPPGRGRTWRVPRDLEVHASPPGDDTHETVSCVLPGGATLEVGERKGSWLEVLGESIELPEPLDEPQPTPEAPPDPSPKDEADPLTDPTAVLSGGCAGQSGLVGYANVKPFFHSKGANWTLRSNNEIYAGQPTKDNDWRTDWSTVCTLDSGTVVKLVEAPVRVRGSGHWIPIYAAAVTPPG